MSVVAEDDFVDCHVIVRCPGIYQFRCLWTIYNYEKESRRTRNKDEILSSKTFSIGTEDGKWSLKICPHQSTTVLTPDGEHVSVFLVFNHDKSKLKELYASYDVSLMKRNGDLCNTHSIGLKLFGKEGSWGFEKWLKASYLLPTTQDILPNGSLNILLTGVVSIERDPSLEVGSFHADDSLFLSNLCNDVILSVDNKHFPAHKAILAAKSIVFKEMFRLATKDTYLNIIDIPNIEHEVFREVLYFIYNDGITPMIDYIADKVLVAADHFQLFWLKKICEEKLIRDIQVSNCIRFLSFATEFNAANLSKMASLFIGENYDLIKEEAEWKKMEREVPILTSFVRNMYENTSRKTTNKKQVQFESPAEPPVVNQQKTEPKIDFSARRHDL